MGIASAIDDLSDIMINIKSEREYLICQTKQSRIL